MACAEGSQIGLTCGGVAGRSGVDSCVGPRPGSSVGKLVLVHGYYDGNLR
jgi:hypothetical protein